MKSPWRRQRLSPSRPHACADRSCLLAVTDMDFCVANIVAIPVLGPRMEEALRWVFEVLTFQRAHVTKTSVGLTDTTTCRGVRSWTTHGGNPHTNGRVMRLPSGVRRREVLKTKKKLQLWHPVLEQSMLEALQKFNHLWLLRSFRVFAMCTAASNKAKTGAVESWT